MLIPWTPLRRGGLCLALLALSGCTKEVTTTPTYIVAGKETSVPATQPAAPSKPKLPATAFKPVVPIPFPKVGTKLDPATVRRLLLRDDIPVLESMNNVYKAGMQIGASRAALVPSVNISAVLSAGVFGFNGLSFLLPFLAPSNWYRLDASKRQLAANGYAFYIVELNEYASALTIYLSLLADQEIEQQQQIRVGNMDQIRNFVESLVKQGLAPAAVFQQAAAQADFTRAQVVDVNTKIADAHVTIGRIFGFEPGKKFYLEEYHPSELPEEKLSAQAILRRVFPGSPEVRQIDSLLYAAQDGTWAASFGYLGGGTAGYDLAGGANPFSGGGSIELGVGIFPQVALSRMVYRELELRKRQIYLEMSKAIQTTLIELEAAKQQLALAIDAEKNACEAYAYTQDQFALGKTSLTEVIQANELVVMAASARIGAHLKVDVQRVNLSRILISGEFRAIPGCHLENLPSRPFGWLDDIFHPDHSITTVDALCRAN